MKVSLKKVCSLALATTLLLCPTQGKTTQVSEIDFTDLTPLGSGKLQGEPPTQMAFLGEVGSGFSFVYDNGSGHNLYADVSMFYSSNGGSTGVKVSVGDAEQFQFSTEATGNWNTYAQSKTLGKLLLRKGENLIRFETVKKDQGYNVRKITLSGFSPAGKAVLGVKTESKEITIAVGESQPLPPLTVTYDDGSKEQITNYTCYSSYDKIAVVENGAVKGLKKGTATLYLEQDGYRAEVPVTVSSDAPELRLDRIAFMTDTGKQTQITAATENTAHLSWSSDNEAVATVDDLGLVTAKGPGDAVITVTAHPEKEGHEPAVEICRVSVDYMGQNPVLPPTWGLFIADGEPHVFEDRVYVYGSRDVYNGMLPNGSRNYCSQDYHVLYSDDLIHWTDAGVSYDLNDYPPLDPKRQELMPDRLWAPDVFKAPDQDKWYLVSCNGGGKNGADKLAEADSPTGPFVNTKLMDKNGGIMTTIDPAVLVDDDGKIYYTVPFTMWQLDPADYSRLLPETETNIGQYMPSTPGMTPFEGPSLRKRNGIYYYIYIQNSSKDSNVPTRMAYMTATSPLGPYTYQGLIIENTNYPNAGNVHGSIVEFKGDWYVCYHMPLADKEAGLTRTMNFEKITFNQDGTINQVVPTSSGVRGAFAVEDTIQASSGVEFSGGSADKRTETRKVPTATPHEYEFTDYPILYFDQKDQFVGYRYVDFTGGAASMEISVRTTGDSAVLEALTDQKTIASIPLPNTGGEWKTIRVPASSPEGKQEVFLLLRQTPAQGRVDVDWFRFTGSGGFLPVTVDSAVQTVTLQRPETTEEADLILSFYDGERLLSARTVPIPAGPAGEMTIPLANTEQGMEVKAYLWN